MDVIEKLRESLLAQIRANVPVQVVYAECKDVDATGGTMTATREGIEYFDVLLGLGQDITVPMVGSRVLLGLLENKRQAAFLLFAESIEERRINGNGYGGMVVAQNLVTKVNALEAQFNQLKGLLGGWTPVPNDGGLALKVATATWAGQAMTPTTAQDIVNPRVSHG